MTTDQGMERIVRSWLEPGLTTLTDDVLDAVMDQLPATPQRRRWSARRIADMNPLAKYAIATAAVVVIALVGFNLLSSRRRQPGRRRSVAVGSAGKQPGSARAGDQRDHRRRALSLELAQRRRHIRPPGRVERQGECPRLHGQERRRTRRIRAELHEPQVRGHHRLRGDPCEAGEMVQIGETVDDLVAALDDQKSTDAVVGDIAAGSVTGERIELRQTPGLERSQCTDGVGESVRDLGERRRE